MVVDKIGVGSEPVSIAISSVRFCGGKAAGAASRQQSPEKMNKRHPHFKYLPKLNRNG
jgi:hypothetical protein